MCTPREDRILYPARGKWFTQWLRRWAPDLAWQEITGFTPAEVKALFQTSKLYVDFGSHPGKDRMPREAATHGCCIITGRRGSAGNAFDVPIPARYKFRDLRLNVPKIVAEAIRATLVEYDQRERLTSPLTAGSLPGRLASSLLRRPGRLAAGLPRLPLKIARKRDR